MFSFSLEHQKNQRCQWMTLEPMMNIHLNMIRNPSVDHSFIGFHHESTGQKKHQNKKNSKEIQMFWYECFLKFVCPIHQSFILDQITYFDSKSINFNLPQLKFFVTTHVQNSLNIQISNQNFSVYTFTNLCTTKKTNTRHFWFSKFSNICDQNQSKNTFLYSPFCQKTGMTWNCGDFWTL